MADMTEFPGGGGEYVWTHGLADGESVRLSIRLSDDGIGVKLELEMRRNGTPRVVLSPSVSHVHARRIARWLDDCAYLAEGNRA